MDPERRPPEEQPGLYEQDDLEWRDRDVHAPPRPDAPVVRGAGPRRPEGDDAEPPGGHDTSGPPT